jgi:hypothetical protein
MTQLNMDELRKIKKDMQRSLEKDDEASGEF